MLRASRRALDLHGLGAELAASGGDGDVAEALWAGLSGGRRSRGMELLQEILCGQDKEEVDHGRDEQEVDDCGEEVAVTDLATVDVCDRITEVRFADDRAKEGVNDVCR